MTSQCLEREESDEEERQVDLARRDPERPLAARVLDQDAHEALDGAEDGAVDDDGADQLVVAVHKLQVWAVSRGSMMDELVAE